MVVTPVTVTVAVDAAARYSPSCGSMVVTPVTVTVAVDAAVMA